MFQLKVVAHTYTMTSTYPHTNPAHQASTKDGLSLLQLIGAFSPDTHIPCLVCPAIRHGEFGEFEPISREHAVWFAYPTQRVDVAGELLSADAEKSQC
jgi:hypothetical protein